MNKILPERIGIMGGTFDPIHYGHLLIAQSAADEFQLERIIFLPTGKSPHKSEGQVTDPAIRCEMVRIAIRENPSFSLSEIEVANSYTNYTYLTLQKFRQMYPGTKLYFIMGEDSLDHLSTWRHPEEICRQASILAAVRSGNQINQVQAKIEQAKKQFGADMYMLHAPAFLISSQEIRERVRTGRSIHYMLPGEVESFISGHSLYKTGWKER